LGVGVGLPWGGGWGSLGGMDPLLLLGVVGSIVLLFGLVLGLRMHAFIALLVSCVGVGLFAGMPLHEIGGTIQRGMASTLGFVATVVGIGAILGKILEDTGGAEALARGLLKVFGEKRAPWALVLTGFAVSIPVFLDVAFIILVPVLYLLARDTGRPLLYFAIPLLAGLGVTHAFVPPTPGPVLVAAYLGADLGRVIGFGFLVGLPTAFVAGPLFGRFISKRIPGVIPEEIERDLAESAARMEGKALPSFWVIASLIALPLVLILGKSLVDTQLKGAERAAVEAAGFDYVTFDRDRGALEAEAAERGIELASLAQVPGGWQSLVVFFGHPILALLASTLVAMAWYRLARGGGAKELMDLSTRALVPTGVIILVTGAGGAFKEVLQDSGVAKALAEGMADVGIAPLALGFVLALLVRILQGSATVAMTTAGAFVAPLALQAELSANHLALLVLAIAAGGSAVSHVNDSGFWLVSRYLGLSEKQTLASWTVMETIVGFVGFSLVLLVALFV
jgi:Gnt-I system low-affinity gluconate transporter